MGSLAPLVAEDGLFLQKVLLGVCHFLLGKRRFNGIGGLFSLHRRLRDRRRGGGAIGAAGDCATGAAGDCATGTAGDCATGAAGGCVTGAAGGCVTGAAGGGMTGAAGGGVTGAAGGGVTGAAGDGVTGAAGGGVTDAAGAEAAPVGSNGFRSGSAVPVPKMAPVLSPFPCSLTKRPAGAVLLTHMESSFRIWGQKRPQPPQRQLQSFMSRFNFPGRSCPAEGRLHPPSTPFRPNLLRP